MSEKEGERDMSMLMVFVHATLSSRQTEGFSLKLPAVPFDCGADVFFSFFSNIDSHRCI